MVQRCPSFSTPRHLTRAENAAPLSAPNADPHETSAEACAMSCPPRNNREAPSLATATAIARRNAADSPSTELIPSKPVPRIQPESDPPRFIPDHRPEAVS